VVTKRKGDEFDCEICDTKFYLRPYGAGKCPGCCQRYEYDESTTIVLSKAQIALLRAAISPVTAGVGGDSTPAHSHNAPAPDATAPGVRGHGLSTGEAG
jgi:hypothetical protein